MSFGMVGMDWEERINWQRMREYRVARTREAMSRHGLGAMLFMYDENVRYVTSTLTPGWNRLKPGLRYAMITEGGEPILFEQGDIGIHVEKHSPWLRKENIRHSFSWIKGAAGPASDMQVGKFTKALLEAIPRIERPPHALLPVIPGQPPALSGLPAGCPFAPRCPRAREDCHEVTPPLEEHEPTHAWACWYPIADGETV